MASTVWGAQGLIDETSPLYTFVYATGENQMNAPGADCFDYKTGTRTINGFVIAAQGGENSLTIKGDPTLVDDVDRPKEVDSSQPKKSAHFTMM